MARQEDDRENLLREATALKERVAWVVPGEPGLVIAGLRSDGRLSVYFDGDPALHFDAEGRLRRAFVGGDLYRSEGDHLSRLTRSRQPDHTGLIRHDPRPDESQALLTTLLTRLMHLTAAIEAGAARTDAIVADLERSEDVVATLHHHLRLAINAAALSPPLVKRP